MNLIFKKLASINPEPESFLHSNGLGQQGCCRFKIMLIYALHESFHKTFGDKSLHFKNAF